MQISCIIHYGKKLILQKLVWWQLKQNIFRKFYLELSGRKSEKIGNFLTFPYVFLASQIIWKDFMGHIIPIYVDILNIPSYKMIPRSLKLTIYIYV